MLHLMRASGLQADALCYTSLIRVACSQADLLLAMQARTFECCRPRSAQPLPCCYHARYCTEGLAATVHRRRGASGLQSAHAGC